MRSVLVPTILLLALQAVACEKFPGFKKASDPSSGAGSASSSGGASEPGASGMTASGEGTPAPGPTEKAPPPAAPADAAATPNPERVILRAGYGDEPISSMVEVERSGSFRLEKRADADAGRELVSCTGSLAVEVAGALWKAVDAAAFAPPEQGFTKPVHAPRTAAAPAKPDAGAAAPPAQARWSVMRVVADLTLVPQNEATARALVTATRAAIAGAEQQSTPATCKRGR